MPIQWNQFNAYLSMIDSKHTTWVHFESDVCDVMLIWNEYFLDCLHHSHFLHGWGVCGHSSPQHISIQQPNKTPHNNAWVHICTRVYVCIHVCMYTFEYIHRCVYVYKHIFIDIYIHVYLHKSICIHVSAYMFMYVSFSIPKCVHRCIMCKYMDV